MRLKVGPMAGMGPATSPLPRECSTTEPHGPSTNPYQRDKQPAATDDAPAANRETALERDAGIEPASLAWKARVLPLNFSRIAQRPLPTRHRIHHCWRGLDSNQCRHKPTDLQSAPFSHSGTPPRNRRV